MPVALPISKLPANASLAQRIKARNFGFGVLIAD